VCVSAETGYGIEQLIDRISQAAASSDKLVEVLIPYNKGDLVSLAHQRCHIVGESYEEQGTLISMLVPPSYQTTFESYEVQPG